jgi:hypothetical protein
MKTIGWFMKTMEMINIGTTKLHSKLRTDARAIVFALIIAFFAGLFPDVISHGIVLPERTGHAELAIIGIFFIISGSCWHWFSRSLYRRHPIANEGTVALVKMMKCKHYNKAIPIYICYKCGQCKE